MVFKSPDFDLKEQSKFDSLVVTAPDVTFLLHSFYVLSDLHRLENQRPLLNNLQQVDYSGRTLPFGFAF